MATFLDVDRVQYVVSSGVCAPLCRLYFCRHCLKLRSTECVSHEVDSHYCPNCLENMPSAEAKIKKNRCLNCFDCPSCRHTLSTRATSVATADSDTPGKSGARKVYYLACGFCRWTSRDVAMKDQIVASGGWQDQENPNEKRIGSLLEYYRQLAQREKADKEKKKYIRRRSYLHLSQTSSQGSYESPKSKSKDKFGLSSVAARRRSGLSTMSSLSLKENEDMKMIDISPSEASEEVDDLPDDIFTKPVNLASVTNITQRHSNPEHQPAATFNLYPRHKHLLIKRSLRCRQCEHNLSKPEFNPSSIKFKIQLVAVHHVPEIRIMSLPNLQQNKESQLILTMLNPLDSLCHVTLLPREQPDEWSTGEVELPKCELVLAPRDDAAEFDETADQQQTFQDDPSIVVFRKSNKIGFFVKVIPKESQGDVKISFLIKYDYKHIATAIGSDNKEPEIVWLEHPVLINLGPSLV